MHIVIAEVHSHTWQQPPTRSRSHQSAAVFFRDTALVPVLRARRDCTPWEQVEDSEKRLQSLLLALVVQGRIERKQHLGLEEGSGFLQLSFPRVGLLDSWNLDVRNGGFRPRDFQ
jgi:hypothetical protein